jgi:hypothetical protein
MHRYPWPPAEVAPNLPLSSHPTQHASALRRTQRLRSMQKEREHFDRIEAMLKQRKAQKEAEEARTAAHTEQRAAEAEEEAAAAAAAEGETARLQEEARPAWRPAAAPLSWPRWPAGLPLVPAAP